MSEKVAKRYIKMVEDWEENTVRHTICGTKEGKRKQADRQTITLWLIHRYCSLQVVWDVFVVRSCEMSLCVDQETNVKEKCETRKRNNYRV